MPKLLLKRAKQKAKRACTCKIVQLLYNHITFLFFKTCVHKKLYQKRNNYARGHSSFSDFIKKYDNI